MLNENYIYFVYIYFINMICMPTLKQSFITARENLLKRIRVASPSVCKSVQ